MVSCKDLDGVRENIDRLDNQIVKLIAERSISLLFKQVKF